MTSKRLTHRIRFRGEVESRHDANALLEEPGDAVLVNRVRPRSFVIACPDGCGAILTINLDARTGKAWRLYRDQRGMTLHPSVWRDGGCEAHFILWRDHLVWFGKRGMYGAEPEYDAAVEARIAAALSDTPRSADELAEATDDIPWEANRALTQLLKTRQAKVVSGRPRRFVRATTSPNDKTKLRPSGLRRWWNNLWR